MRLFKKTLLATAVLAAAFLPQAFAETPADMKGQAFGLIEKMVSSYLSRIAELETENAQLKSELATLKAGTAPSTPAAAIPVAPSASASSTGAVAATGSAVKTGNAQQDALIASTNARLPEILKEYGLAADTQLGLFEFVDGANAFFISLDDGKNPEGVTAFKKKVLYSYDRD